MTNIDSVNHDKHYARYSYESLILQQSHIPFDGLWTNGVHYFAVCPALDTGSMANNGEPLIEWFNQKCRVITSPVTIVASAPVATLKVPERSAEELSQLHGEPLTLTDVYRELISALPKNFPTFKLNAGVGKAKFYFESTLTQDETDTLKIIYANLNLSLEMEVLVINKLPEDGQASAVRVKGPDALALISSKGLTGISSKLVREKYEEDEEFWIDKRLSIFSTGLTDRHAVLPDAFTEDSSACFVDASVFPTKNIRTYLTLYRRVIIAMPLASNLEAALQSLAVSKSEIVELARLNRVQFVLPQSIERYSISFITQIIEANPSAALFSRQLASASIVETRKRLPILYPPFGSQERRAILELFANVDKSSFGVVSKIIREQLGSMWVGMELNLSTRGAMGTARQGISPILGELYHQLTGKDVRCPTKAYSTAGELYHQLTGKDVRLELMACSSSIEWAVALNATYFPIEVDGYSEAPAAQLCASVYSGVKNQSIINPIQNLEVLVNGLLTLNNDAPVLEVAEAFADNDIEKLRQLVLKNGAGTDVETMIQSINKEVQHFEKNQNRLARLDMYGLASAAVAAASVTTNVLPSSIYVPLGAWVVQYVLKNADSSKDAGGPVLDWLRAKNTWSNKDAVLISRLRNKLK